MADEKGVVKYQDRSGQEITLSFPVIKDYLVVGRKELITAQELIFFMGLCKARGLNPFAKDCYLIKYTQEEPAAIIVSIDFFRARARAQEDCQGWQKGIIVTDSNGKVRRSSGLILENETLVGGWFRAKPKGWDEPFEHEVNLKGYIKRRKDGSLTRFWSAENQPTMISKVAEAQGLRTLWPSEFAKIYTSEEMQQTDVIDLMPAPQEDTRTTTEKLLEKTTKRGRPPKEPQEQPDSQETTSPDAPGDTISEAPLVNHSLETPKNPTKHITGAQLALISQLCKAKDYPMDAILQEWELEEIEKANEEQGENIIAFLRGLKPPIKGEGGD